MFGKKERKKERKKEGVTKVQYNIYFDILWLFYVFELNLDLTCDSKLCSLSHMDFAASINREVECF